MPCRTVIHDKSCIVPKTAIELPCHVIFAKRDWSWGWDLLTFLVRIALCRLQWTSERWRKNCFSCVRLLMFRFISAPPSLLRKTKRQNMWPAILPSHTYGKEQPLGVVVCWSFKGSCKKMRESGSLSVQNMNLMYLIRVASLPMCTRMHLLFSPSNLGSIVRTCGQVHH